MSQDVKLYRDGNQFAALPFGDLAQRLRGA